MRWGPRPPGTPLAFSTAVNNFTVFYLSAGENLYPDIHKIIKISAVRPPSTAGNQKSFSALMRLKTYLRSTMSAERLSSLAMTYIHKNVLLIHMML